MTIKLGCIADDFTGATDLANNLVRAGMRTVQAIGVPAGPLETPADAVVVALKTRTLPAAEAVAQSLAALAWLRAQGAGQIYFKYCSTFDSTPAGNIGPVADALMTALDTDFTIATPAFPDNQRTVFKGYLFAGDVPLNESGMRDHPLTPMTDANLVRVLAAQTRRKVGLIDYAVVARGARAIHDRIDELRQAGVEIAIVDAISNDDLLALGSAAKDLPLVTGGSGVAIGLPGNWGLAPGAAAGLPRAAGAQAVVAGSCSTATQGQVAAFIATGRPALALDPLRIDAGDDVVAQALAWAAPRLPDGPILIYSTARPDTVQAAQASLGAARAGALVEDAIARIAVGLARLGVRQLIVAGGETSGAAVRALGLAQLAIGEQIDPGVPWCAGYAQAVQARISIALKSGNFGGRRFLHAGVPPDCLRTDRRPLRRAFEGGRVQRCARRRRLAALTMWMRAASRAASSSWRRMASAMASCSRSTARIWSAWRASLPRVTRVAASRYWLTNASVARKYGLPVARAMLRWKATSSLTPSPPLSTAVAMAASASSMAAMSRSPRRAAACAAISVSSARRRSTMCSTASSEASSAASMRSARLPSWPVTNTPLPWRASTMPSWRSRDTASRMTVRLTPNCSARRVSVGSFSPGSTRPASISASNCLATVSVSVGGVLSRGNAMAWGRVSKAGHRPGSGGS